MFIGASAGIGRFFPRPVSGGGGSASNLLLDDYPGAEMAVSLRKLTNAYTGSAIEVNNGTSLLDIGFVDGELDTAAIIAHCGGSNGTIRTWYDQSGNGNDFIQDISTHQPKIYSGSLGTIYMEKGKPIATTNGSDFMKTASYTGVSAAMSFNVVEKAANNILHSHSNQNYTLINHAGHSSTVLSKVVGTPTYFVDGVEQSWATRADVGVTLGGDSSLLTVLCQTNHQSSVMTDLSMGYEGAATSYPMFSTQEMVWYNSDKTADREAIETAINSFYSIYVPVVTPTHVFLLAGQSNMVGRAGFDGGAGYPSGTQQYTKSTGFDSSYSDTTLIDAASPLGHWDANSGDMGLAIDFITDYVAANNVNAVLIPAADGGTGFANASWGIGKPQYLHAVNSTNALMSANPTWEFQAVLWHQGESDQANANFGEAFYLMIQSMRNDITVATQDTPFILGEILAGGNATTALNTGVLAETTTYNYNTALVSSAGLTSFDNLHFDAASLRTFGSRYHTALSTLDNAYPTVEAGATGHWVFGKSNQLNIDLAGTASMTEQGVSPTYTLASTSIEGVTTSQLGIPINNGLDTGIAETADMTTCAVFEYEATGELNMIMGNLGLHAFPGGHAFFRNSAGDLRFNERGGTGVKLLRSAADLVVGNHYFIACSLAADDSFILMIADTTNEQFNVVGTGSGRTLGTGRNLGAGCVHYQDTNFKGETNLSELITFDTAKTLNELKAIALRSRDRMALRGITIEATPSYSFLLNDYGASEIALSLRKLDSTYTGSAVEVFNGTSMADIGFVDNELDTTALAAHCGSNDGTVATWYDQSGNGKDFVQTDASRRPKLYDGASASVVLENGKPMLEGGNNRFMTLASYTGQAGVRIFNVVKGGFNSVHLGNGTDNYTAVLQNGNTGTPSKQSGTVVYRADGSEITTANRDTIHDALASQSVFTINCDTAGDVVDYDNLAIGYEPNAGVFPMLSMQEMVLFHTDVSADETAIENSINDFYSVF